MNRTFKMLATTLLLMAVYGTAAAMDAEATAVLEKCRLEAESKGAENVQDYISSCLDEIMQYDTSSD